MIRSARLGDWRNCPRSATPRRPLRLLGCAGRRPPRLDCGPVMRDKRDGSPALMSDPMEPERPQVDRAARRYTEVEVLFANDFECGLTLLIHTNDIRTAIRACANSP